MKHFLLLLTVICFTLKAHSQTKYKLKDAYSDQLRDSIVKQVDSLFYYRADVDYNLTTSHIKPYKALKGDEVLKESYLQDKLALLAKDTSDCFIYSNIASYYLWQGDKPKAQEYYAQAYKRIRLMPGAKDSAVYYSYRAMLKSNLGMDPIVDAEKALAINKADSIMLSFYPMYLLEKRDFEKAKKVSILLLDTKNYSSGGYLMLYMTEMLEYLSKVLAEGDVAKLAEGNIADVVHMEQYQKYLTSKSKEHVYIDNMGRVLVCMAKFMNWMADEKYIPGPDSFAYIEETEKILKKMLKEKDVNKYSVYYSLGTVYMCWKKYPQALEYYEKALAEFPVGKEAYGYNTMDVYDNMASIYYVQKNYDKAIEVLEKKLTVRPLTTSEEAESYLGIGGLYFVKGDYQKAADSARRAQGKTESFQLYFFLTYVSYKMNSMAFADVYRYKCEKLISTKEDFCNYIEANVNTLVSQQRVDDAWNFYEGNPVEGVGCENCLEFLKKYTVLNN